MNPQQILDIYIYIYIYIDSGKQKEEKKIITNP